MSSTQTSYSVESTQAGENSGDEDENDEMLDPRVKIELESLNTATTEINDVEQELEEMHAVFRQTLSESAFVLKTQSNILGKCVKRSRPYYEKLDYAKKLQVETQKAALNYERACSQHQAAKLAVAHAEQKLTSTSTEHKTLDHTWQEMLNKAIKKVMDSEFQKQQSEQEHLHTAQRLTLANKEISDMKVKLKSSISKSRVYYDLRDKYMEVLEGHKQKILSLQQRLKNSKQSYSRSLRKLESISDEIHELRKSQVDLTGPRQDGVGAESSETITESDMNTDDKAAAPDGSEDDSDEFVVIIDINGDDDDNKIDIDDDDDGDDDDDNSDQNVSETDDIENSDSALQAETTNSNGGCIAENFDSSCEHDSIGKDVQKQDFENNDGNCGNDLIVKDVQKHDDVENCNTYCGNDSIGKDVSQRDAIDDNAAADRIVQNVEHIDQANACLPDLTDQPGESTSRTDQTDNVGYYNTNGILNTSTKDDLHKETNNINHMKEASEDNSNQNEANAVDLEDDEQRDAGFEDEIKGNNVSSCEVIQTDETKQDTDSCQEINGVDAQLSESTEHDKLTNEQNTVIQKIDLNGDNNNCEPGKTLDSVEQDSDDHTV